MILAEDTLRVKDEGKTIYTSPISCVSIRNRGALIAEVVPAREGQGGWWKEEIKHEQKSLGADDDAVCVPVSTCSFETLCASLRTHAVEDMQPHKVVAKAGREAKA